MKSGRMYVATLLMALDEVVYGIVCVDTDDDGFCESERKR